jgi:hypothetical protein
MLPITPAAGADVFAAEIFVARYGLVAERQQRVTKTC